ncbi:Defect at low temperature protein 1 [Cytospora mali]|uniref:Defect at low temperature protein 1 n=1 Tax=Cytospora mali TaxID=578113 RepID=A0A194UNU8_CYTMA|nr:Defect at low temperature protein 1 [Valsa mali var. pyri (nom. inval.)]
MGWLHLIFRVVYDSLYLFLSVILLLLLCVTPADSIRQALMNKQRFHIFTIIICLSVTVAFVVFVYIIRLYINRTALANIPKPWIPIGKGEAKKSVRKMIAASLSRSAAIAYESRPRVIPARPDTATTDQTGADRDKRGNPVLRLFGLRKAPTAEDKMGITLPPHRPVWGEIEHNGWASPNSPDLPNLQYSTVISELPNLIEAKALTLAPPAPGATPGRPILDPEAIALLQRPGNLALRQYLAQLAELGVLEASRMTADFLSAYEYARYSTRPISNARFRELMHLFAEILRTMQPLDPAVLTGLDDDASMLTESDIDDDAPRRSPSTPRSQFSGQHSLHRQRSTASHATTTTAGSGSNGSSRSSNSVRRPQQRRMHVARNSSQGTWGGTYRTAPTTPKSRKTAVSPTSSPSSFFAPTRQQTYPPPTHPPGSRGASASTLSLSARSVASAGGGSVIRLSERADATALPYVLTLGDARH